MTRSLHLLHLAIVSKMMDKFLHLHTLACFACLDMVPSMQLSDQFFVEMRDKQNWSFVLAHRKGREILDTSFLNLLSVIAYTRLPEAELQLI